MTKTSQNSWSFFRTQFMGVLSGTAASKRYESRLLVASLLLAGSKLLLIMLQAPPWLIPMDLLLSASFVAFLCYSFLRLLKEADELERQIHLESIATAFVIGLGLSAIAGVVCSLYSWTINPGWFCGLEILRSIVVGLKARQFES